MGYVLSQEIKLLPEILRALKVFSIQSIVAILIIICFHYNLFEKLYNKLVQCKPNKFLLNLRSIN